MLEEDGYRMKFACYYPRVEYGFQVKVLREDARAAFRLFETSITQVLHFCMKGMGGWVGRAGEIAGS